MEILKNKYENILVIQTAFLGDAILTLPLIQKLNDKFLDAKIDVVSNPSTVEIFKASLYVRNIFVLDKRGNHKSLTDLYNFVKELRKNNYTKIFSPHRSFRSGLITLLLQVDDTTGFDNSSLKYAYKNLVKYNLDDHEVKRNLLFTGENFNNDDWKIIPKVVIDQQLKDEVKKYINENNLSNGFFAIAPGSVWQTKRYPDKYFSQLINALIAEGHKIVMVGGSEDKELCEIIALNCTDFPVIAAGRFNILGSIELLKYSNLLITNDSAPTHLGVTADIPVLTIYCSTVPDFGFYAYNKRSSYISYDDLNCKPCGIHGYHNCPIATFDCGYKLTTNDILSKIKQMMQTNE